MDGTRKGHPKWGNLFTKKTHGMNSLISGY